MYKSILLVSALLVSSLSFGQSTPTDNEVEEFTQGVCDCANTYITETKTVIKIFEEFSKLEGNPDLQAFFAEYLSNLPEDEKRSVANDLVNFSIQMKSQELEVCMEDLNNHITGELDELMGESEFVKRCLNSVSDDCIMTKLIMQVALAQAKS